MFIYTVKPGDSLFSISQRFDVPIDLIRSVNAVVSPNIVPGQALLINTNVYTVQPGDSFYRISQKAYISLDELIAANPGINPNTLQPGMKLTLPEPSNFNASTFSYCYITGTEKDELLIKDFAPYSTYYSFFEYNFNSDGSLSSLDDLPAIEAAWNSNTAPLATVTNLTPTGFSGELTSQMLNNTSTRNTLIDNIFTLVSENGYAGVNIDFEGMYADDRDMFSTFLSKLRGRLHEKDLLLTIAVPPKTSDDISWHQGYDYGAIGSVVDLMFIMAYDWHHRASGPGPVAPINEVQQTVEYALENMDSSKVILGVPLYGYDWKLPYNPDSLATAMSNQRAVELAMEHQVPINYSREYEAPYFYYVDESGQDHVVWFEDSRSITAKIQPVRDYDLQGIGAWQVGLGFYQGPWLLTKFFNIRKVT